MDAPRGLKAPGKAGTVAAILVAALIAFQAVRTAAVVDRAVNPAFAAALWPGHPAVITDRALLAIAAAATRGNAVSAATRAEVRRVATRAPLSADPFLIEGAIAESEGRGAVAERLLLEARNRDPRSRGTRYLLAERFLRTGRIAEGLTEMKVLVQLHESGATMGPALVAFAQSPGAAPQLRSFFAANPQTEASVLAVLAGDARNADLVLSLATNRRNPDPDWRAVLLTVLANSGQYRRAYDLWRDFSSLAGRPLLFNPAFGKSAALAPFNWVYPQSGDGLAEPDGRGGLRILYYGRARAVLASQLLMLKPGPYVLGMRVDRVDGPDGAMRWTLRCAVDGKAISEVPVANGRVKGTFQVPSDCSAQWLELVGEPRDVEQSSELTISELRLARGAVR